MATSKSTTTSVTTTSTPCPCALAGTATEAVMSVGAGTFVGVTGKVQASHNGTDYFDWPFYDVHGALQDAGATITLTDSAAAFIARVGGLQGFADVRFLATGWSSGSAPVTVSVGVYGTNSGVPPVQAAGAGAFSSVTSSGLVKSTSPSAGVGYATGAGAAVTQGSSRTTSVTINAVAGAITLVSAAGSATPFTMTVTNSAVAATDTVVVSQKSGTDAYSAEVSAVGAGSFKLTITDLTGTTTEQPVFNFAVIKSVAS